MSSAFTRQLFVKVSYNRIQSFKPHSPRRRGSVDVAGAALKDMAGFCRLLAGARLEIRPEIAQGGYKYERQVSFCCLALA